MKHLLFLLVLLISIEHALSQDCACTDAPEALSNLKISDLSPEEKQEAIQAWIAGSCYYKGIKLWGKVKYVTSFPDIKIQYVESFPDIKVKYVTSFPDKCGLWQVTESFPDFKVQVVTSFPDIKVKIVESFPGVD